MIANPFTPYGASRNPPPLLVYGRHDSWLSSETLLFVVTSARRPTDASGRVTTTTGVDDRRRTWCVVLICGIAVWFGRCSVADVDSQAAHDVTGAGQWWPVFTRRRCVRARVLYTHISPHRMHSVGAAGYCYRRRDVPWSVCMSIYWAAARQWAPKKNGWTDPCRLGEGQTCVGQGTLH